MTTACNLLAWWRPLVLLGVFLNSVAGTYLEVLAFQALCSEDKGLHFVRSDPWNCNSFLMCMAGVSIPGNCPPGQVFSSNTYRCQQPQADELRRCGRSVIASLEAACATNPAVQFPSPFSCAQYFDCSSAPPRVPWAPGPSSQRTLQLMECPYPSLYDVKTRTCQRFDRVSCQTRPEVKAPCDYLQYQQTCETPSCQSCSKRHPSCVGLENGAHPLPGYTTLYILCYAERTFDVRKCNSGYTYSVSKRRCVPVVV